MFDRRSLHALNKNDKDAIVSVDAYQKKYKLTAEDFVSEAEYGKWKAWLDQAYHEEEKGDHIYSDHTVPMELITMLSDGIESPEEKLIEAIEHDEWWNWCRMVLDEIKSVLSEKQFRRLWMYYGKGMTEEIIAEEEGTSHQAVSKCINAARKRIERSMKER